MNDYGQIPAQGAFPAVEYSLQVMEELRLAADEGFQKLLRGGIEVGAVLYGTYSGGVVRVEEWRLIECRHAQGPGFVLDDEDLEQLQQSLGQWSASPSLASMQAVGWLHTHTRSEVGLSDADIAIHNRFFTEPWQLAIVMRIRKDETPLAGVFFRDGSGALPNEPIGELIPVVPNPALLLRPRRLSAEIPKVADAPPAVPGREPRSRLESGPPRRFRKMGFSPTDTVPTPKSADPLPDVGESPAETPRHIPSAYDRVAPMPLEDGLVAMKRGSPWKWVFAATAFIAVAAAALFYQFYWKPTEQLGIGLQANASDGDQILIQWDHSAPLIQNASRGILEIDDGGKKTEITLDRAELRGGNVTYTRRGVTVRVRLVMQEGTTFREALTTYSGTPIAVVNTPADLQSAEAAVAAEIATAKEGVKQEQDATKAIRQEMFKMDARLKKGR